jgi:hypothetical protein
MKYLYHGSNVKMDLLEPKKPTDKDSSHSKKAVYATSNKKIALGFAVVHSRKISAFKDRKTGIMNIVKGRPKKKATVYLHVLDAKDFVRNKKDEFISTKKVKPIKIKEYKVGDLSELWRKSNKKELKEFLKDRNAWRIPK